MLQDLVDFTIARGLKGLETLAGIPGLGGRGGYGNAGAYGHSISERVVKVQFFDGAGRARVRQRGVRVSLSREHFQAAQGVDHLLDAAAAGRGGRGRLRKTRRRYSESAEREVSRRR